MVAANPDAAGASEEAAFVTFARQVEPRLRVALTARFGPERGREAACDALTWAWEHWDRVRALDNPGGYLYRVGARRASRWRWSRPVTDDLTPAEAGARIEPGLERALGCLSVRQRQAVVLTEGYGLSQAEVAALLGIRRVTVQTHVRRGLDRLRQELGVSIDA